MVNDNRGILVALVATAFFASDSIFSKLLLEKLDPLTLAATSQLISIVAIFMMWGVLPELRKLVHLTGKQHLALVAVGILASVIGPLCFLAGLQQTTAANAIVLSRLTAVFGNILAVWWLGELMTRRQWTGVGVMFLGIGIFVNPLQGGSIQTSQGDLYLIAAAMSLGLATTIFKKYLSTTSPELAVLMRNIVGTAVLFALPFVIGTGPAALTALSGSSWMLLLAFALIAIVAAQFLWYKALEMIPSSSVSSISIVAPVFGLAMAATILGETFTSLHVVGGIVTLVGFALLVIKKSLPFPQHLSWHPRLWYH